LFEDGSNGGKMVNEKADHPNKTKDRKLGDQWADWDGRGETIDPKIEASLSLFFILATANILILGLIISAGLYLIKPRIDQFNPIAMDLIEWFVIVALIGFLVLTVTAGTSLFFKFGRTMIPYKWLEKLVLGLLPKTIWLGSKFGISRDRVGNSFIKLNNLITKSYADKLDVDRLLVLLPRCLKKEARTHIMDKLEGKALQVLTVSGGEEAREAIKQCRPKLILALACERDLMSGIKDVAEKVPVLAVTNRRPEGPCKNTDIRMADLEEALAFITEIGKLR
jgi:hypothetical protein